MNHETLLFVTQCVLLAFCFSAHLRISKETKQNKALKKQIKELEDLQLRHVVILSETVDRMLCLENKLGARDTEKEIESAKPTDQ